MLKHYFRPGPELFRVVIYRPMPELLVGRGSTREEEMREVLEGMTNRNWQKSREQLLKMLPPVRYAGAGSS